MKKDIPLLVKHCVTYLQREEEFLTRVLAVTEDMHVSLLSRDDQQIATLIDRYQSMSNDAEGLSLSRGDIKQMMVLQLGVAPEEATITALLQHCDGPSKSALAAVQGRVHRLSSRLNSTLAANSNLARQMLEVLNNVFRALGAHEASPPVYGPSGRPAMV